MNKDYTEIVCCECGVSIWVKPSFHKSLVQTKQLFYCVNGHCQSFTENNEDRLKKQLAEKERRIAELLSRPPREKIVYKIEEFKQPKAKRGRKPSGQNNENFLKIEKLLKGE